MYFKTSYLENLKTESIPGDLIASWLVVSKVGGPELTILAGQDQIWLVRTGGLTLDCSVQALI